MGLAEVKQTISRVLKPRPSPVELAGIYLQAVSGLKAEAARTQDPTNIDDSLYLENLLRIRAEQFGMTVQPGDPLKNKVYYDSGQGKNWQGKESFLSGLYLRLGNGRVAPTVYREYPIPGRETDYLATHDGLPTDIGIDYFKRRRARIRDPREKRTLSRWIDILDAHSMPGTPPGSDWALDAVLEYTAHELWELAKKPDGLHKQHWKDAERYRSQRLLFFHHAP